MFQPATQRSRGILVVAMICAFAALILAGQLARPAIAYAAPLEQAKPTTHPVEGRESCLTCHQAGGGIKPAPAWWHVRQLSRPSTGWVVGFACSRGAA